MRAQRGVKAKVEAGHCIGSTTDPSSNQVHALGSVVAQAASGEGLDHGISQHNVRYRKIAGKGKRSILFMVDTSGSMLSSERLAMVKGCVVSLLKDAYVNRIRVGIVSFGGDHAQLVLPFTTSPELAATRIDAMPGGGKTPLLEAIELAIPLIDTEQGTQTEVILLSDGRYHRPVGVAAEKIIRQFGAFCAKRQVPIHLIDVGSPTPTSRKRTARLALMLKADYRKLDDMRADALAELVPTF